MRQISIYGAGHLTKSLVTGLRQILPDKSIKVYNRTADKVVELLPTFDHIHVVGVHFHVGSQITDLTVFQDLCVRLREIQQFFLDKNISLQHINVGGGLGWGYSNVGYNLNPSNRQTVAHAALKTGDVIGRQIGRTGRAIVCLHA